MSGALSGGAPGRQAAAERELVGAVLAVFAHEANNRLATLGETAGLLGDLLETSREGRGEAVRECRRAAAGLETQLAQLGELVRRLDRLGAAFRGAGGADAAGLLEDLLALTARLARQRQVRVVREAAPGLPPLAAHPGAFLALAHRLLTAGLARCPAGGTLRVAAARAGAREVRLGFECGAGGGGIADEALGALVEAVGGRIEESGAPGEVAVVLPAAD